MPSAISAEDVFIGFDQLWVRLSENRNVNRLDITMEDGTRSFSEMRVFDNTPHGDFGLEREVHYFNTIGRIIEYRADIVTPAVFLSISVSLIGRRGPLAGFYLDPDPLPELEAGQFQEIMGRLAKAEWTPKEDQAEEILGGFEQQPL